MSDVINELILGTTRPPSGDERDGDARMVGAKGGRPDRDVRSPVCLAEGGPQILFDGPPAEIDRCRDRRVTQFVRGEAGERLLEMQQNGL